MKTSLTYSQLHVIKKMADGKDSPYSSITNPTMSALERLGFVSWVGDLCGWRGGRWVLTDEGRARAEAT